jgi:hypothetical protein
MGFGRAMNRKSRDISLIYPLAIQHSHGKSPFLIGKPSINRQFSMAMLNNQRVIDDKNRHTHIYIYIHDISLIIIDISLMIRCFIDTHVLRYTCAMVRLLVFQYKGWSLLKAQPCEMKQRPCR